MAPVAQNYNGQNAMLTFPGAYFNDSEEDRLHGYSLEIDHPFGDTGNLLERRRRLHQVDTGKYNISQYVPGGADAIASDVPPTSGQPLQHILARYVGNLGPRASSR